MATDPQLGNGAWVYQPAPVHTCDRPIDLGTAVVGAVWECADCKAQWEVRANDVGKKHLARRQFREQSGPGRGPRAQRRLDPPVWPPDE